MFPIFRGILIENMCKFLKIQQKIEIRLMWGPTADRPRELSKRKASGSERGGSGAAFCVRSASGARLVARIIKL